jgi:tRNA1(Val) A37 N6-methylase TrmN6
VERDPALAALAAGNLADNGARGIQVLVADVAQGAALAPARFHHAFANPPWHPAAATPSPDRGRDAARRAPRGTEQLWALALAAALVRHGTLTLILPAAGLPAWIAALGAAGCGTLRLLPLWPRAGQPARLVLVRAIRDGAGACALLAGLVLHEADGGFTAEAQAILRGGGALALD